MRWKPLGVLACLTIVNTSLGAKWYSLNGGTAQSLPTNGQISVGTVNGQVLLRVWSDAPSTESVQALEVTGTAGTSPELQVLIAGPGALAFPDLAQQEISSLAANDLAGLSFGTNDTLRDASRLVVAINGQVTGPIDCGQAFRIQARLGTSADGDITAHAGEGVAAYNACEVVLNIFSGGGCLIEPLVPKSADTPTLALPTAASPGIASLYTFVGLAL